jgi:hypothetical protein
VLNFEWFKLNRFFLTLEVNVIPDQNQTTELIINGNDVNEIPKILTQEKAHTSLSDRYSLVKTVDVLKVFENAGFEWKLVSQEKCRGHYAGYGTHLVSLEHPEIVFKDSALGREIKPRLYLKNSYHGRSRLMLDLGIFRMYCQNGLFVGMMLESFRKKHIGLTSEDLIQVVADMKETYSEKVAPMIGNLMTTQMSEQSQLEFAKAALAERLSSNGAFISGEYEKLLITHRPEDQGDSAWTVLNRVQENLGLNFRRSPVDISYSYMAEDKDGKNQVKERKVSKLSRLDEVTRMNKYLFDTVLANNSTMDQQLLKVA